MPLECRMQGGLTCRYVCMQNEHLRGLAVAMSHMCQGSCSAHVRRDVLCAYLGAVTEPGLWLRFNPAVFLLGCTPAEAGVLSAWLGIV